MRIPTGPGADEPPPLLGRKKANALGHLGRRRVARLVADLRRKTIEEGLDVRPLGSHEREEQREVVHLRERVEFSPPAPAVGVAETVAVPEQAARAADAELVVDLADGR